MSKQIIILKQVGLPSDASFEYILWATVPSARKGLFANGSITSQYLNATSDELIALQNGSVVESSGKVTYKIGTPIATIQADLEGKFAAFQKFITEQNAYVQYGTYWDGSSWTAGGVA